MSESRTPKQIADDLEAKAVKDDKEEKEQADRAAKDKAATAKADKADRAERAEAAKEKVLEQHTPTPHSHPETNPQMHTPVPPLVPSSVAAADPFGPRTHPTPRAGSGQPNAPFTNPDTASNVADAIRRQHSTEHEVHMPVALPYRDAANQGAGLYQENAPGRSTVAVPPTVVAALHVPVPVPTGGRKFEPDEQDRAMQAIAAQQLVVQRETDLLNLMRGQFALYKAF